MKKQFYIVGNYYDNPAELSDFGLAYIGDYAADIAEHTKNRRAVLGIATISDETREAFIQSVKTAGIPEELRNLNIEIAFPFDGDYAEFIEAGCEKYGIDPDELEML